MKEAREGVDVGRGVGLRIGVSSAEKGVVSDEVMVRSKVNNAWMRVDKGIV